MATTAEINAFIKKLGSLAVAESNRRIANGGGFVLPSVCIAQSALETGWGSSGLMTRANAFFGIKAGGSWTGKVYTADTWEVANGAAYNTTANFRAYDTLEDSVRDYYELITNTRYKSALSYGTDRSAWKTPRACITAIWAGGYATDTLYVEKIMNTINARKLYEWDNKVDGVGVGVTGEPNTEPDYTFTKSDFIQGGGPEFVLLNTPITAKTDTVYTVNGIMDGYVLHVYEGDMPAIGREIKNGETLTVKAGVNVGLLIGKEGLVAEITPSHIENPITLTNANNLGYGLNFDESYNTPIAHFVKI